MTTEVIVAVAVLAVLVFRYLLTRTEAATKRFVEIRRLELDSHRQVARTHDIGVRERA